MLPLILRIAFSPHNQTSFVLTRKPALEYQFTNCGTDKTAGYKTIFPDLIWRRDECKNSEAVSALNLFEFITVSLIEMPGRGYGEK
jgi:hypothetical protein